MLVLASTSDKIQVITGSAVSTINVHTSWIDDNAGTITPGNTNTSITGAATTTIVGSPASSVYRSVKGITIYNSNASSSNKITIQLVNGTSTSTLLVYTLLAGETIQYFDTIGFEVLDISGSRKVTVPSGKLVNIGYLTITGATQTFNYAVSPLTNNVRIHMWGGGGAGGGCTTNTNMNFGGAGGAGGYTEVFTPVNPGAVYVAVVGGRGNGASGGTGGAGTNTNWTGNATSSTVIWTAQGGAGGAVLGAGNASFSFSAVSAQGSANTANSPNISMPGEGGGAGWRNNATSGSSGYGAICPFLTGQPAAYVTASAAAAGVNPGSTIGYGSGGSGAGGNSATAGANGAPGLIIVEEYS